MAGTLLLIQADDCGKKNAMTRQWRERHWLSFMHCVSGNYICSSPSNSSRTIRESNICEPRQTSPREKQDGSSSWRTLTSRLSIALVQRMLLMPCRAALSQASSTSRSAWIRNQAFKISCSKSIPLIVFLAPLSLDSGAMTDSY